MAGQAKKKNIKKSRHGLKLQLLVQQRVHIVRKNLKWAGETFLKEKVKLKALSIYHETCHKVRYRFIV